ncbi:MAG: hypothetical protein AAGA96_01940 [Verrucomicrobiota bacterium]
MNVRIIILAAAVATASFTEGNAVESTLFWANGDALPGRAKSIDQEMLRWDSPIFTGPLTVSASALRSIVYPGADELVGIDAPFRFDTAGGDVLYGEVLTIDQSSVTAQFPRHGRVEIKRDELVSLQRTVNSASVALGGLEGWKTLSEDREVSAWQAGSRGSVQTKIRRAELFRFMEVPDLAECELSLSWQGKPGFEFSICRDDEVRHAESVHLEVWEDELVLVKGNEFEPVKRLSKGQGNIQLRIYLDGEKGEVTVCSHEGQQLARISNGVTAGAKGARGIFLRNKDSDLTLEMLRVASWNGRLPAPLQTGENRLHLISGEVLEDVVDYLDEESGMLKLRGNAEGKGIAFDELDTLYFAAPPRSPAEGEVRIAYHDGSYLQGKLTELSEVHATLETTFATEPVDCSLEEAREIGWSAKSEEAPEGGDVLFWEGGRSHGSIVEENGGDFPIAWRPVGSEAPASLNPDASIRLVRRSVDQSETFKEEFSDAVFLTDFTVLRCRVESVDDRGALVATPFNSGLTMVANDMLKAIEFESEDGLDGFADPDWRSTGDEGGVKIEDGVVRFTGAGGIRHPSALMGPEVSFKLAWKKDIRLEMQLRLFGDAPESESGSALNCGISCDWTEMSITDPFGISYPVPGVRSAEADFRITSVGERLLVSVNGRQVFENKLRDGRPGRGIDFIVSSLSNSRGGLPPWATVSDFQSRMAMGETTLYVPESARKRLLTVPRQTESNPPRHFVVASNGDVLRGELLTADRETVRFRAKLRELAIPRNRVTGLIWLHPGKESAPRSGFSRVLLADERLLTLDPQSLEEGTLGGRSSIFGEIGVPFRQIREIHLGSYLPPEAAAPYASWELRDAGGGAPAASSTSSRPLESGTPKSEMLTSSDSAPKAGVVTLQFLSFPKDLDPQPIKLLVGDSDVIEVEIPSNELSKAYKVTRMSKWSVGESSIDESGEPVFKTYGQAKALDSPKQLLILVRKGEDNADGFDVIPIDSRISKFGGGSVFIMNAAELDINGLVGDEEFELAPGKTTIIKPKPDPEKKHLCHAALYYKKDEKPKGFFSAMWPLQEQARGLVFVFNDPDNSRLRLHSIQDYFD